ADREHRRPGADLPGGHGHLHPGERADLLGRPGAGPADGPYRGPADVAGCPGPDGRYRLARRRSPAGVRTSPWSWLRSVALTDRAHSRRSSSGRNRVRISGTVLPTASSTASAIIPPSTSQDRRPITAKVCSAAPASPVLEAGRTNCA